MITSAAVNKNAMDLTANQDFHIFNFFKI